MNLTTKTRHKERRCSRNWDVGFELRLSEVISFQSINYYDFVPWCFSGYE